LSVPIGSKLSKFADILNLKILNYLTATRIHNGKQWLPQGSIVALEDDGTINAILKDGAIDLAQAQHYEGILCPGFINAHCHLELSHMKGAVEEGNRLVPFLQSVMLGRNNFSAEEKAVALEAAIKEMEQNGIVAVGDIANGPDTLPYRERAGFHIHTFVESIGFTETNLADRFAWPQKVFRDFAAQKNNKHLLRQSIAPHAPYSVSAGMFGLINGFEKNSLLTIHNEETQAENDFYENKTGEMFDLYQTLNINTDFFQPSGKTSLQTYMPFIDEEHPVVLVHNTFTGPEDIDWLKTARRNVFLCLCPNANWYIERRMPPVNLFKDSGLTVCLGTDSLASNHQLSIWSEVQTLQKHFPEIDLEVLLTWATFNGALALQMDDIIGSLEPGKKPGIVHIGSTQQIKKIF
jgi:cytosine/adenosine deaminase-related metal-dependent hydrolase